MAIGVRDRKGRAGARYSDGELYGLVRRVAVWVNRRRPTKITQAEFDTARTGAGLPDLPSARAICMRLGAEGKSMPWAEVLEIACTERASPEISEGHRRRNGGNDDHLGERHLYFAMNLIARHLDARSLGPGDYERGCQELIDQEARRRSGVHPAQPQLLAELLPNAAQIERIVRRSNGASPAEASNGSASGESAGEAGAADSDDQIAEGLVSGGRGVATGGADWDLALRMAGLEPRAVLVEERSRAASKAWGLPLVEAIHAFVEANGRWPSRRAMDKFCELADIGVQQRTRGRSWSSYLEEARAVRDQLGLSSPAEMPEGNRNRGLEIKVPAEGIPGAPRRRKNERGQYTREDLLDGLERFDDEMPASAPRTRTAYGHFAKENGLPSPSTLDRQGNGFTAMLAEARQRRRR